MSGLPEGEAMGLSTVTGGVHPSREGLDRELRAIKDAVLRMGSLVERQILAALQALIDHDPVAAEAVMAGDRLVNDGQREAEALIALTIATQQPVARDLRFLLALDRVTYELERIGDHATSVAKQARKLAPFAPLAGYLGLPQMARIAADLVSGILLALIDVDEERARAVAARDDEIDALYHATFDDVLRLMRLDPDNVEPGTRILFATHYIERIGDRVTNIAEDVVFLASGQVVDLNP
jgi:phosphate transport system protein